MSTQNSHFSFNISLSILNHLGRNLYRSFATVLGEAISNSWDADAKNVWITLNREANTFSIKDDGVGMNNNDFQEKFLKVGYSKRGSGNENTHTESGRPFIGRKGIGKLALLSCAQKITIISKVSGEDYIGGQIDNSALDQAIDDDNSVYDLENINWEVFGDETENHQQGTIIFFEGLHSGIQNTADYLKKIVALYFRFSLIDESFNIFINGEKITEAALQSLGDNTEFLWNINQLVDPYINNSLPNLKESGHLTTEHNITGFIASTEKPSHLKIFSTEEKAGIDLFVNGRLRERDILKNMPAYSTRHIASYLYGQIHFNELDRGELDSFTSSREGVVESDPLYQELLSTLKTNILEPISNQWDEWRLEHKKEGDPENPRRSRKERGALQLANATFEEFTKTPTTPASQPATARTSSAPTKEDVNEWCSELLSDAEFNFSAYADCFVAENLVRKYMHHQNITLSNGSQTEISEWQERETQRKQDGNINIDIREENDDLSYLDIRNLAKEVDIHNGNAGTSDCLTNDSKPFIPIRNALMHTARLTKEAKTRLMTIRDNIKFKIRNLL